jgi:hypothetical protein
MIKNFYLLNWQFIFLKYDNVERDLFLFSLSIILEIDLKKFILNKYKRKKIWIFYKFYFKLN